MNGFDIYFVHVRGEGTSERPLLLTHGWPGSFVEMLELIPYPKLFAEHLNRFFSFIKHLIVSILVKVMNNQYNWLPSAQSCPQP
ncbi:epoxide hydrolase N-terminal domain-containing protein [Paenibacillus polymyxa]|uniref:epoxide hydrolase N-terminal domain-containing protein n=1 Tax=Paenibacillus polymyxa TaxID=1406 RepID=UPI0039906EA3